MVLKIFNINIPPREYYEIYKTIRSSRYNNEIGYGVRFVSFWGLFSSKIVIWKCITNFKFNYSIEEPEVIKINDIIKSFIEIKKPLVGINASYHVCTMLSRDKTVLRFNDVSDFIKICPELII